jgi:hypothetical protein
MRDSSSLETIFNTKKPELLMNNKINVQDGSQKIKFDLTLDEKTQDRSNNLMISMKHRGKCIWSPKHSIRSPIRETKSPSIFPTSPMSYTESPDFDLSPLVSPVVEVEPLKMPFMLQSPPKTLKRLKSIESVDEGKDSCINFTPVCPSTATQFAKIVLN